MAVTNLRTKRALVWIPPIYTADYKITVETNGVEEDITNVILNCEFESGINEAIGIFSFTIFDPNEEYVNKWSGGEIFRYYSDYADDSTTARFKGEIEKPSKRGNKLLVKGRSRGLRFSDITVTRSYSNQETSAILADLVSRYGEGLFTTNNVSASTTSLTVTWTQKPFWDCVTELTTASGFDCYIDPNDDFNYFESGTRLNYQDAIVHEYNLLEVGDFTPDLALIKNRVIVYGAINEGIQDVYTAEDADSIALYGAKEEVINDDNVTTATQAEELAEFKLSELKDPPDIGDVRGLLLATIQPGESIQISSPADGLVPQFYRMVSFKHVIDLEGEIYTEVKINKELRKLSNVLKNIIENDNKKNTTSINPEEMRFSYNDTFDSDSGTHTNTEVSDGALRATSAGNWISDTKPLGKGVLLSEVYLIATGNLTGVTFDVTGITGSSFESVTPKVKTQITTTQGNQLRVRVNFSDTSAYVSSLSVLYNVTS